jgi:hypothetical protein
VFVFGHTGGARGPFTFEGNKLTVTGDVRDEDSVGAMVFAAATSVTIRDNDLLLPAPKGMPAVELRNCHDVVISGNRVTGASRLVMSDSASGNVNAT